MDTQKFTEKSLLALENSQSEALRRKNSELNTVHLLNSLVFQENGLIQRILEKMNIDIPKLSKLLEKSLNSLPSYTGISEGRLISSREMNQALIDAEDEAQKLKDEFISVEHLLLALTKKNAKERVGRIFNEI